MIGRIWDVAQQASLGGLGLAWVIIHGILLWSLVGVLLGVGLYLVVVKLGGLDAPKGQRRRWARIVFALTMVLVFAPLAGGVGLVTQVKGKVRGVLLSTLDKAGASQAVGRLLLLPVLMAKNISTDVVNRASATKKPAGTTEKAADASPPATAPTRKQTEKKTKKKKGLLSRLASRVFGGEPKPERSGPDVSFLLKVERQGVVGTLAAGTARKVLRNASVYRKLREQSALAGMVADLAVDFVCQKADKKISVYTQFLKGMEAGDDGKLFLSEAARHVGERFFKKTFIPYVEAPFDSLRWKLIFLALALPLLVFGGIRLGLRRSGKSPPGLTS